MTGDLYVAYGSNLHKAMMRARCPKASPLCTGTLRDRRLLFCGEPGYSYLTIEPCPGQEVPVAVWKVTPECVAAIDWYEGYPDLYRKETIQVATATGVLEDAFVYVINRPTPAEPAPSYMETCRQGYADFGFDQAILDRALEQTREQIKNTKE